MSLRKISFYATLQFVKAWRIWKRWCKSSILTVTDRLLTETNLHQRKIMAVFGVTLPTQLH